MVQKAGIILIKQTDGYSPFKCVQGGCAYNGPERNPGKPKASVAILWTMGHKLLINKGMLAYRVSADRPHPRISADPPLPIYGVEVTQDRGGSKTLFRNTCPDACKPSSLPFLFMGGFFGGGGVTNNLVKTRSCPPGARSARGLDVLSGGPGGPSHA